MKRVSRDASLHEKTVQAAVKPKAAVKPTERRPRCGTPELTVTQVHPGIWSTALKLAGGDAKRITVLSATKVVVAPPS